MRREVERRPALVACCGLILGLIALYLPATMLLWPAALLLSGLRLKLAFAGPLVLGVVLAPIVPERGIERQQQFQGAGVVASVPRLFQDAAACEVQTDIGKFVLFAPRDTHLVYGDELNLTGTLKPLSESSEDYWLKRGVTGVMGVESADLSFRRRGTLLAGLGADWRDSFLAFSSSHLAPEVVHTVDALSFNVDTLLPEELKQNLRRSGTVHIVSASGLHVLILAAALFFLLSLVPIPRTLQLFLLISVLSVYGMATGLRPPIVRAIAMALVLLVAYGLRREADLLSAVAITAFLYLLWQPRAVFDVGFQLSFVIVAALALYLKYERKGERLLDSVRAGAASSVRASFVATIAGAPLVAYYFGELSVVSIPANLLIAGVLPAITVGSMASHLLSFVSPAFAAGVMGIVVEPLTAWVLLIVDFLGSPEWAALEVPAFSAYWIPLFYLACLLIWRPVARPV